MRKIMLAAAALAVLTSAAGATEYDIDAAHTTIGFKAKHVVGKVPGRFTKFSGTFTYDPKNPKSWKTEATIDPASIDTDNAARDKHLRSDAFFDVAKCPAMTFKSTGVTDVKDDHAKLHGDLTMHCVTKPVVLDLEIDGTGAVWGTESASFTATVRVNRHDWGIDFDSKLDSGGFLIGDYIDIVLDVSGNVHKAAEDKKADAK
jgi:polyisoprenoid-binding protein YceI